MSNDSVSDPMLAAPAQIASVHLLHNNAGQQHFDADRVGLRCIAGTRIGAGRAQRQPQGPAVPIKR